MMLRLTTILFMAALTACTAVLTQRAPAALDEAELRAHLFAFADDSMLGRRAGVESGIRASRYIAERLARAGLEPAGENGSFYQPVPLVRIRSESTSTLTIGGASLRYDTDFVVATPRWRLAQASNARVIFLGSTAADTTGWPSREALRGKVVLFDRPASATTAVATAPARYLDAVAAVLVTADMDSLPANARNPLTGLSPATLPHQMPPAPPVILVSPRVAELAMTAPLKSVVKGAEGAMVSANIRRSEEPLPTYNVVAVLRGTDPALRDEYVVVGAHPDHVGTRANPLDHDSLRAVLRMAERMGHERGRRLTGSERAQLSVRTDTLVRSGPPRPDSVFNGADDDGSGSMLVLALAESFLRTGLRPRRSVLFVWHHAEEMGLLGSRHFADNPTVPREAIVAAINLDMVGRGGADDIPGGGPRYVQVVGSRRLSTELGELVESVNGRLAEPMQFDYSMDAEGHPERIYCRSDHANYARYGIPVVFFTTGLHADYHQLTDEPQYVDYSKLRRVGELTGALVMELANADSRPAVDRPVPDPFAPCRQ
ncbi:MAG TPA: M28 family peptidase [Gemmatimonadaceae bacterium]|nr:M28 family peptidase [Gemmatimonadaceae bacterium]